MLLFTAGSGIACGPFDIRIENPLTFHFYHNNEVLIVAEKDENIILWQSLTSASIPKADIEEAVYNSSYAKLSGYFDDADCSNAFVRWLKKNDADELREFLLLAKQVEEMRAHRVSPWYFPTDRSGFDNTQDEKNKFDEILATCEKHKRDFLADRYALQAIRVLLSTGEYQRCIDYYDATLKSFPDDNLFKKMAKRYIAGCLYRLGEKQKAYVLFAEAGDFNAIYPHVTAYESEKYLKILAHSNPESVVLKSRLNGFIGYGTADDNLLYLPVADAALSSPYIKHRGDWLFLKAYIEAVYNYNYAKALKYIHQANTSSFSALEMAQDAHFFEICMRAQCGRVASWQQDFKWIENTDSYRYQEGIWYYIIPGLLKKGMTNEALLLANYGTASDASGNDKNGKPVEAYANAGFQLLLSLKPSDVIRYKRMLRGSSSPLTQEVRSDDDYLNEIIGTLYLREGNYSKAAEYLSMVSEEYQESMNIYKYLVYDPWTFCFSPADKWAHEWYRCDFVPEDTPVLRPKIEKAQARRLSTAKNAKLNFATEMARLEQLMKTAGTTDARLLAKLKHTIGRYNSFNTCWALTQYWAGETRHRKYRSFYYLWDGGIHELDYLVDAPRQLNGMDEWLESEISSILNGLHSPTALAQANMMIRNYHTIARHYPDSKEGKYLSTHCDGWKDWI